MLGKLLPIILALSGLGAGVGAGIALRPAPEMVESENPCGDVAKEEEMAEETKRPDPLTETTDTSEFDYIKLNNQFVVPIVSESRVEALMVLSLSLEVTIGAAEEVYRVEPKLRDTFLQVMFDHANAGGFTGPFTEISRMRVLRNALYQAGSRILGESLSDVLIVDVVRQDT